MASAAPVIVERVDIHKSCKSLETIVSVLANYTEAANAMATVQKKLAKALKEAASVKGTDNVSANALAASAGIFEGLAEVDVKFAKIVDREVENVGNELKKWFKKLAKEEKAHDERIANATAKIKQAGQLYERKAKRKDRDVADEHSRYIAILNSVGPEMSKDKQNHGLFVTQRHTAALFGFAASLSRLAEAEWIRVCELVRRSAPSIGDVGHWRVFCEGGWSGSIPESLPDVDNNEGPGSETGPGAFFTTVVPRSISARNPIGPSLNTTEDHESPISSSNTKPPPSTRKTSEGYSGVEHLNAHHRSSSSDANETFTQDTEKKYPNLLSEQGVSGPPVATKPTAGDVLNDSNTSPRHMSTPEGASPGPNDTHEKYNNLGSPLGIDPTARKELVHPDPDGTLNTEKNANQSAFPKGSLSTVDNKDILPEKKRLKSVQKSDFELIGDSEGDKSVSAPLKGIDLAKEGRSVNVGGNLDRRLSVESSLSSHNLVATMRERYDSRPTNSSSPPPRDLPRLAQRVTDLATFYTPFEPPSSPPLINGINSPQPGLSADRFPTFQDRYPRSDREKERFRQYPASPTPNRDYFGDHDKLRHREYPTADRNQFLRDDRDRDRTMRPRSPERQYFDELGMRNRQGQIETVEEMSLQEREANLREQKRQLDIERARLANAREGGYTSDTNRGRLSLSPYGALRHTESPSPIGSQQSLRTSPTATPYDHSPNCGCQRCSAQHYGSTTSLPRAHHDPVAVPGQSPIYKPDPPILLRPEKPKNWIRRMSMPVASLVLSGDKKASVVSAASRQGRTNLEQPDEDRRVRRRSFELGRDQREEGFGGTTR